MDFELATVYDVRIMTGYGTRSRVSLRAIKTIALRALPVKNRRLDAEGVVLTIDTVFRDVLLVTELARRTSLSEIVGPSTETASPMSPLTAELLIVELGERLATAACGSLLAELGATVVMVERTTPQPSVSGKAPHRATMAAGKRTVVLDDEDPDNIDLVQNLISKADAVIVSSDLDGRWPDAIAAALKDCANTCDITAFIGPASELALSEGLMQAFTGTIDTTGDPDSTSDGDARARIGNYYRHLCRRRHHSGANRAPKRQHLPGTPYIVVRLRD